MHQQYITDRLEANAHIINSLAGGLTQEQACRRIDENKWTILEIINHLCDEEKEDFRCRLDLTLGDPGIDWPPIDPSGWVLERNYNERSLEDSLSDFLNERKKSVEWLNSLHSPNWKSTHHHPLLGPLTAKKILINWLAHDLLHIRQLTTLHWNYLCSISDLKNTDYAGKW